MALTTIEILLLDHSADVFVGCERWIILCTPVTAAILDEETHRGMELVKSDPKEEDDWLKNEGRAKGRKNFRLSTNPNSLPINRLDYEWPLIPPRDSLREDVTQGEREKIKVMSLCHVSWIHVPGDFHTCSLDILAWLSLSEKRVWSLSTLRMKINPSGLMPKLYWFYSVQFVTNMKITVPDGNGTNALLHTVQVFYHWATSW